MTNKIWLQKKSTLLFLSLFLALLESTVKMDGKQRGNSAIQHNDILMCLDKGEHSVFVVIDLSAALDITDRTIHNNRLQN